MVIDNKAWITIYEKDFSPDKYIYHYTTFDAAIIIFNSMSLRFSNICKANDTVESKPKLVFPSGVTESDEERIINFFININTFGLKMLCFTRDNTIDNYIEKDLLKLYADYSGRGFSLPRMWAQYAGNNSGICLVFDKAKLLSLVDKQIKLLVIKKENVNYIDQFVGYKIESEIVDNVLNYLNGEGSKTGNTIIGMRLFSKFPQLVNYNYFNKLDDWKGEHEYRIIAMNDKDIFINHIDEALTGVVIGERIPIEKERIIKMFCQDLIQIKKISFTSNGCKLENVN